MNKKQREKCANTTIDRVWELLSTYEYSDLIPGDYVQKESSTKWSVHNGSGERQNIQDIEVTSVKETYTIEIKITPRNQKHVSYDMLRLILKEQDKQTNVLVSYEYHPSTFIEKVFAKVLEHEDQLFTEFSTKLFDELQAYMLTCIYG